MTVAVDWTGPTIILMRELVLLDELASGYTEDDHGLLCIKGGSSIGT